MPNHGVPGSSFCVCRGHPAFASKAGSGLKSPEAASAYWRAPLPQCGIVLDVASDAQDALREGLKAVDNVLSFAKSGVGRPSARERSLFVASVALSYAVWENFVEDLLVEAVEFLSANIAPSDVPEAAKTFISRDASAWDLAVDPGWRALWVTRIRERAKGREDEDRSFGLLTADIAGVRRLFTNAGLDPFRGLAKAKQGELDGLVRLRGEIVHTGKAPDSFVKADAVGSKQVVTDLATHVAKVIAEQVNSMANQSPW